MLKEGAAQKNKKRVSKVRAGISSNIIPRHERGHAANITPSRHALCI